MSRSARACPRAAHRLMQRTNLSCVGDRSRTPTRRSAYTPRTSCEHLRSSANICNDSGESPLLERRRAHRPRICRRRFAGCSQRANLQVTFGCRTWRPTGRSTSAQQPMAIGDRKVRPPRALQQRNMRSIFSQNCLGLKTATRRTELIAMLRRRGAFAACLQETWRQGTEELQEDGWLFVGTAPPSQHGRGSQGVAIMLSPPAAAALDTAHTDLGARVVAVRLLDARDRGILLISGYAPVSTAPDEDWDAYYDSLACAIARGRPGGLVIVGTDANASIGRGSLSGCDDGVRAGAVGPHGLEHINASGRRLRVSPRNARDT